jgi:hypothetical protein
MVNKANREPLDTVLTAHENKQKALKPSWRCIPNHERKANNEWADTQEHSERVQANDIENDNPKDDVKYPAQERRNEPQNIDLHGEIKQFLNVPVHHELKGPTKSAGVLDWRL